MEYFIVIFLPSDPRYDSNSYSIFVYIMILYRYIFSRCFRLIGNKYLCHLLLGSDYVALKHPSFGYREASTCFVNE